MRTASLSLKNLIRRPRRTVLTVAGVAIAATAYILLVSLGASLVREIQSTVNLLPSEVTVQQAGTGFPELSWISKDQFEALHSVPGVHDAWAVAIRVSRFEAGRHGVVLGAGPEVLIPRRARFLDGRPPRPATDEIMFGSQVADDLDLTPGDTFELQGTALAVVGVYEFGHSLLDRGAVLPLETHQRVFEIGNRFNLAFLQLTEGAEPERVREEIHSLFPDLEAVGTDRLTSHYGQIDEIGTLVARIATVAYLIAALIVANVMLANVTERIDEIGVLRAIGWRRRRLFAMVIGEGIALALLGGLVGIPSAAIALDVLAGMDSIGYVPGGVASGVAGTAVLLTSISGAVGSVPAIVRAARIEAARALREG